jgi:hypothetical protein
MFSALPPAFPLPRRPMPIFRSRCAPLLRVLLLVCAAAACGGDGPMGGGGKGGKQPIAVGQVYAGNLASAAQADTFLVSSAAAGDAALFLQALGGSVQAVIALEGGSALATVVAPAAGREEPSGVVQLAAGATYRVVVTAASGSSGGGSRARVGLRGTAPERAPATLTPGAVVEGERLESPTDVDDFTFTGAAGDVYIAYVQAGPGAGVLRASVSQGAGASLAHADSRGGDAELEAQATGRIALTVPGEYRVRVSAGVGDEAYLGDYRLQLRKVSTAPESRVGVIVAGDTVPEAIDYVGDVDEFVLSGTAGDSYNVFFAADPATVRGSLVLDAESELAARQRAVSDGGQVLLLNATGPITLRADGRYVLRVFGGSDRGLHRGGYRLFVYRIDPRPEHVPATLALNDSVLGERIDAPGDVDVFTFDVPRESLVLVSIGVESSLGTGLAVATVTSLFPATLTSQAGPGGNGGSFPEVLSPGRHTVRVTTTPQEGAGFAASYRLRILAVDGNPEHVPAAIAIGDVVTGEDIAPVGDRDGFTFQGTAGQEVNLFLQGLQGSGDTGLAAMLLKEGQGVPLRVVYAPFGSPTLRAHGTRLVLPGTGTYRVSVSPSRSGSVFDEQGPYRFGVLPATRAPEHVSATQAVGSTVTAESVDYPSDVDEYLVHATPGSRMEVEFHFATQDVTLAAYDPATGALIGLQPNHGAEQNNVFTVPAGGTVRLVVLEGFFCQPDGNCEFGVTGPYTLSIR